MLPRAVSFSSHIRVAAVRQVPLDKGRPILALPIHAASPPEHAISIFIQIFFRVHITSCQWRIQGGRPPPLLTGCILKREKNFAPKCTIFTQNFKKFSGEGILHPLPFRPPISNFWIHHCVLLFIDHLIYFVYSG